MLSSLQGIGIQWIPIAQNIYVSWYIPRDGLMMREWPYTDQYIPSLGSVYNVYNISGGERVWSWFNHRPSRVSWKLLLPAKCCHFQTFFSIWSNIQICFLIYLVKWQNKIFLNLNKCPPTYHPWKVGFLSLWHQYHRCQQLQMLTCPSWILKSLKTSWNKKTSLQIAIKEVKRILHTHWIRVWHSYGFWYERISE